MKINGEPVEVVRELSELRPGATLYYKPCGWCGADWHRTMVFKSLPVLSGMLPSGEEDVISGGWTCIPAPACSPPRHTFVVTARAVANGVIFRVVDPLLERGAETATRKPMGAKT